MSKKNKYSSSPSSLQMACFDIWLLLKKNLKIQLRHRLATILELIVPCTLILLVAILRTKISVHEFDKPTIYPEFNLLKEPKIFNLTGDKCKIFFTSNNYDIDDKIISNIMKKLIDNIYKNINKNCTSQVFTDTDDMIDSYLNNNNGTILCGIEFDLDSTNKTDIKFSLRFSNLPRTIEKNEQKIEDWKTQVIMKNVMPSGPRDKNQTYGGVPGYYNEGFLFIQHLLTIAIADELFPKKIHEINDIQLFAQRFPYPKYIDDLFLFSLNFLFPTIFMFSFYFSSINLTKTIVNEKEKRLKESMKMMGLKEKYHFIAYLIKSLIFTIPAIILIIIILKLSFKPKISPPILISDSIILFIYFLLYHICITCFSFMLSTFFSKANVAGIVCGIISFLTYLPYYPMIEQYNNYTEIQKLLTCLMPNTNMAFGVFIMLMRETRGIPVTWNNILEPAIPNDSLTFFVILIMFILNSFIYLIVTWYMTLAFPGEYGVPLVWYFPLTKNYWFPSSNNNMNYNYNNKNLNSNNNYLNNNDAIETYPRNLKVGLSIQNLCKTYNNGQTYSVKNLSFDVFQNQITALLGHNGAGKTTTISLLCGLFPPSDGTAFVNGYNVRTEINQIRSSLGICPQSNLLFDELTVEEHLDFYCRLKHTNLSDKEIKDEIKSMVKKLDLEDKFNVASCKLSGGMKRKLSVGIAFIGGSKIVILDEPTSGMDVSARRFIWDLLLQEKYGRSIIISTHFMEEADILGDRIAIMDTGSLRCYGSPLFLKRHFGAGYHLRMEKKSADIDTNSITKIVYDYVPDAKIESSVGIEVTYSLPSEQIGNFAPLLRYIENDLNDRIVTYGISITTMEEVFLKVGNHNQQKTKSLTINQNENDSKSNSKSLSLKFSNGNRKNIQKNSGFTLLTQQYYALLIKRFLYAYRSLLLTIIPLIIPMLMLIINILIIRSIPQLEPFKKLDMNLKQFNKPYIKYFVENNLSIANDYMEILKNEMNEDRIIAIHNDSNITNEIISVDNFVYNYEFAISALFKMIDSKLKIVALFNDQAFHTPSISLKYVDQAIIQYLYGEKIQLTISNYPMPLTTAENLEKNKSLMNIQSDFQISEAIIMGLSFFLSSYTLLIVEERIIKSKHLQKISGLRMSLYWLSFLIFDYVQYILVTITIIISLVLFKVDNFHETQQMLCLFVGYSLCGLSLIPFVYCLSYLFTIPATAYARLSLILILSSIGTMIIDQLTLIEQFNLKNVNNILKPIFQLFVPLFDINKINSNIQMNLRNFDICDKTFNDQPIRNFCKDLDPKIYSEIPDENKKQIERLRPCCPDYCTDICLNYEENYFSLNEPGIGSTLLYIIGSAFIYWFILYCIETKIFEMIKNLIESMTKNSSNNNNNNKLKNKYQDDDVQAEKLFTNKIVSMNEQSKYSLLINNLTKQYGKFTAVNNISYSVKAGECFGLLGVNGAGKTTTFKMITGDETITKGDIFINGSNNKNNQYKSLSKIGYCPQFDALLDKLTGEETLRFYSRLRGIQENDIDEQIMELSQLLYFEMHLKKLTSYYSGGNKRKLSTAIALLGNPAVSFLDEPTSGVDPVARRCLWEAINQKLQQNISIVLTSHSMEECEALCNRLIIMVNGQIECIGSPLHLKTKFGNSYNLIMRIMLHQQQSSSLLSSSLSSSSSSLSSFKKLSNELDEKINSIKKFMSKKFPTSQLKAIHNNQMEYVIKNQSTYIIRCSDIFDLIEKNKQKLHLEDYSVSQTNLEQIFLSFARKQRESLENDIIDIDNDNNEIEEISTSF